MEQVSDRLARLTASATIAMNQRSKDLQAEGIDVINLSVGEPDFNMPDHIKEAAKKAIDDNFSFYPPVAGFPALKKAIVEKLKEQNGLDYTPDQIVVSNGAKHSIVNVLLSIINAGDEVIIPAPYWVSYAEQVKISDGTNVILDTGIDNDFKVTPEQVQRAITPRTRAMLLCSPSNPTGCVYSKDELEGLAAVLAPHERIIIISDEIYEHINYVGKHESIAQFNSVRDRVVLVNGVSKGYAMMGWRLGYMAAPAWITKAVTKLQGQFTSGVTTVGQIAAITALTGDQGPTMEMKKAFKRRRDLVLGHLETIDEVKCSKPEGAFYVFPDMSAYFGKSVEGKEIKDSGDLCMYLLESGHIATVPGSAFGAPDCVRISFATSDEDLEKAMERLKNALAKMS